MPDTLQGRLMGQGLRLLNRFSGSRLLDDPARRSLVSKWIYGASRTGFTAMGLANRPFKAAGKLLQAARKQQRAAGALFDLSPDADQAMILEAVREFSAEMLRPAAAAADAAKAVDPALLAAGAELGLAAINLPEELGGTATERTQVTEVLVAEALAHGDMGIALRLLSAASVANLLVRAGNAAQQARYLTAFSGESPPHAALALCEAHGEPSAGSGACTATRTEQGYRLDGLKPLVIDAAHAELFLVGARLDGELRVFIVEAGTPGLSWAPQASMGLHAAALSALALDGVTLGEDCLLEAVPAAELIAGGRMAISALAIGCCQAVLDYVIPYVNERHAFGEPISNRQAVAFMVSNIGIELSGARLVLHRAAARAANGQSHEREAALAYELMQRHGPRIGSDGVQLLGGHGYVCEHPVERWYRDLNAVPHLQSSLWF